MDAAPDNAIGKAVILLKALRTAELGGSARELAAETGIARSTVQRTLGTLAATGMVLQDPVSQRYRIGPQALLIGLGYKQGMNLASLARPFMVAIRDRTGETVGLSVAVDDARVFLEEVQSNSELRFASELGRLYPLWSGASGRILLSGLRGTEVDRILESRRLTDTVHRVLPVTEIRAELELIRSDGFAATSDETIATVGSVAVPIHDASRVVVAALSISGPASRLTRERTMEVLPVLRDAAQKLSARLGAHPDPGAPAVS